MKWTILNLLVLNSFLSFSQISNPPKKVLIVSNVTVSKQLDYLLKADSLNKYDVTYFDNRGSLSYTFELFFGKFNPPNSESYIDYTHYFDMIILEEGGSQFLVASKEDLIKSIKKYEVCLKPDGKILFISNQIFKLNYPTVLCSRVINDGYEPRFGKDICSDSLYSEKQLVDIFENKENEIREQCKRCKITPSRDAYTYFQRDNPTIKLWKNTDSISNIGRFINSLIYFSIITGQQVSALKNLNPTSLNVSTLDFTSTLNTLSAFLNRQ